MPITEYRTMIGEAMNIGNLYRQGEFKLQTDEEKGKEMKRRLDKARAEGEVNG